MKIHDRLPWSPPLYGIGPQRRDAVVLGDELTFCIDSMDKDLEKLAFERDKSFVGRCPASNSKLLAMLTGPDGHEGVRLDDDSLERLITWMDVYAQRLGSFGEQQEQQLRELRRKWALLLAE